MSLYSRAMPLSKIPCLRVLACSLLFTTLLAHAEQTWTEVRSPHFRVITNGSAGDARKVATEFEQMRQVFADRFNDDQLESGAPLTIVAARDGSTFKELHPQEWKASKGEIAGEFLHGWEKQFAIIRLDTWNDQNQIVVYHEYTHSVLHARFHWLPMWLDEGFAEFYAYTRFEPNRTLIGAPSQRYRELQDQSLLKVTEMIDTTSYSSIFRDSNRMQLFYAEAWALVHYMTFGPGMNGGRKLNEFFKLIQTEVPQKEAFQQIFGDPKVFDKNFSQYLNTMTLQAGVSPAGKHLDQKTFAEKKLTPAEADYEIGCFETGTHNYTAALAMTEKSLTLDPNLATAHEDLGFLDFRLGKDSEAQAEWKLALALNPNLSRSLFASTMSGSPLSDQTPDQLRATQQTMKHITELAPNFAPAYVELALIEWQLGSIQQAYNDAHQAEKLEPWRAGYHILTGRILLRGNKPAMAAANSRYVAAHWFGPDHNEAVDLWNAIPPASQGDGPPLALDMPPDTKVLVGTVQDVSCGTTPGERLSVIFTPDSTTDSKPITFKSDGRLMIGFSDTFWWGEDHYNSCYHLSNHRAVVAYKVQSQQLLDLEIRDDLPTEIRPAKTETADTSKATRP